MTTTQLLEIAVVGHVCLQHLAREGLESQIRNYSLWKLVGWSCNISSTQQVFLVDATKQNKQKQIQY